MPKTTTKIEREPGDEHNPLGKIVYTYSDGAVAEYNIEQRSGKEFIFDDEEILRYLITDDRPKLSDYKNCIFLAPTKFYFRAEFSNPAKFSGAHFAHVCNFFNAEFHEIVDFTAARFLGGASFSMAKFHKKVFFCGAQFSGQAIFGGVTFDDDVDFECALFLNGAFFWDAKFKASAKFDKAHFFDDAVWGENDKFSGKTEFVGMGSFVKTQFNKLASFQNVKFSQPVNFEFTNVRELLMLSNISKKSVLLSVNLKGAVVNNIDYTNTIFRYANRETAMVLKNLAVKQRDQVNALEFAKAEMDVYRGELAKEKRSVSNVTNRFILFVEKWGSDYGTNPLWAFGWLVLWNGAFLGLAWLRSGCFPCSPDNAISALKWWQVIYYPVNVFLIYEIQKSLRKFSRRL